MIPLNTLDDLFGNRTVRAVFDGGADEAIGMLARLHFMPPGFPNIDSTDVAEISVSFRFFADDGRIRDANVRQRDTRRTTIGRKWYNISRGAERVSQNVFPIPALGIVQKMT